MSLPLLALVLLGPWRGYEVYQPTIARAYVNDCDAQGLKYNHDSAVAWFGDRWFCLWNANSVPEEGRPGQLNYQATSRDGLSWSTPVACFSDPAACATPVPCPRGTQWQPNLLVVEGELWAVWTQFSGDALAGTYLARLDRPDGQWRCQRLLFDGQPDPQLDGAPWSIFATQNPVRLRSGRVLAPVTISQRGGRAADAPAGIDSWWAQPKRNSVLYSDDRGATWRCSPGAWQTGRSWAQWEPTVWEAADGRVLMLARNNDPRTVAQGGPRPSQMLLLSSSADGGATWTPHQPVPLETVSSRMQVLPLAGGRHLLLHNDWPAAQFVRDRRNLALFFARGDGPPFSAGPGFSGDEPVVAYPQGWIAGDRLLVSYSQGNQYRSIKVASISPLPRPDRWYLWPRSNLPPSPRPQFAAGGLTFGGEQRVAGRAPATCQGQFTVAALLQAREGVVFDNRPENAVAGVVLVLSGGKPFAHLRTPEGNLFSALQLPPDGGYLALSADAAGGWAEFRVGQQADRQRIGPPTVGFGGGAPAVGHKRLSSSALSGLHGRVRRLYWFDRLLTPAEHAALAAGQPPADARLVLDPADAAALARDWELPAEQAAGGLRVAGPRVTFAGEASAGVESDPGLPLAVQLRGRLVSGSRHVLLTVGDADRAVRLEHLDGRLQLTAGEASSPLGAVGPAFDLTLQYDGQQVTCGTARLPLPPGPQGTWLYLGEAYRRGLLPAEAVWELDLPNLRTRTGAAD
ncbi:MAG: exo-alpha-sialidase [Fimbriimonadaceae bacterium]|nr:exo-alpha-sialidase [Fimbriimonadaceae bacterium]